MPSIILLVLYGFILIGNAILVFSSIRRVRKREWKYLKENPANIRFIQNPTKSEQNYVLDLNLENIQYIMAPSKSVQKRVLKARPDLINLIQNLHPSLQTKFKHEVELSTIDL